MIIVDCIQKSHEWYKARCGIPTASNFDKIITTKGEQSKQRQKYLYQLAGEAVIGKPEETYTNGSMLRGIELEAEARDFYSLVNAVDVLQVGFCLADGYGASPDGLVGGDGLIEIKCPQLSTHVGYLLEGKLPTEYFQQVQGELFVTGRKWCDFISYYPCMKPFIFRVEPDQTFQSKLKIELESFCRELNEIIEKVQ